MIGGIFFLQVNGHVHKACVISVILNGSKTGVLEVEDEHALFDM